VGAVNRYDVGDLARLTTATTDLAGNPANPTTIVFWWTDPTGAVSHGTPTPVTTGVYRYELPLDQPGTWSYWWITTGAVAVAGGGVLSVSPQLVPSADGPAGTATPAVLLTVAEARDHLNITSPTYDGKLQSYVDAAAEVLEEIGDIVIPRTVTETYDGGGTTIQLLRIPVLAVASVTEYVGTVPYPLTAAASPAQAVGPYCYQLDGSRIVRLAVGTPQAFPPGLARVAVTYTAGQTKVPARYRLAVRELVAHWWRWGQQGARPAFGDAVPDMAMVSAQGYAIPNRVVELIRPIPGVA
jgi:hypothetical protein